MHRAQVVGPALLSKRNRDSVREMSWDRSDNNLLPLGRALRLHPMEHQAQPSRTRRSALPIRNHLRRHRRTKECRDPLGNPRCSSTTPPGLIGSKRRCPGTHRTFGWYRSCVTLQQCTAPIDTCLLLCRKGRPRKGCWMARPAPRTAHCRCMRQAHRIDRKPDFRRASRRESDLARIGPAHCRCPAPNIRKRSLRRARQRYPRTPRHSGEDCRSGKDCLG